MAPLWKIGLLRAVVQNVILANPGRKVKRAVRLLQDSHRRDCRANPCLEKPSLISSFIGYKVNQNPGLAKSCCEQSYQGFMLRPCGPLLSDPLNLLVRALWPCFGRRSWRVFLQGTQHFLTSYSHTTAQL